MKRPATPLVLACLLVLPVLAPAARAADEPPPKPRLTSRPSTSPQKPADPNRLTPENFHSPKLRGWINDVPDTGQFLADSVWIMRVGPRVTTAGDFVREYFNSYPEYRPAPDSAGRVKFLQTLLNRDVLGLTALAQNRAQSFEDRLALREQRQRSLASAVFMRYVRDSVRVSDDEVRRLWQSYAFTQHFRHIVVDDRATAERVRRELVAGQVPWAVAVKRYSIAKNDPGPDGGLGWVSPDKLEPAMALAIYPLKPGELSLPVRDSQGWHIVQSIERKPIQAPDYEASKRSIRALIASVRQQEIGERFMARLRAENGVVYDSAAARIASSKFGESMTVQQGAGFQSTISIDASTPEFSNEDTARVIARWNGGGRYSIGELVHTFSDIPPVMRPTLNRVDALLAFTESIILEPAIAEFGARHGLEQDPLVAIPVQRKTEELMVEHMYQDSVGSRVWVSKEDRKAYYEKNKAKFFTYPSVDFAAILRSSKAGADSVERMLKSGVKATTILRQDSLGGFVSGSIQHRRQDEQGPYQTALFEEMRPGDIQVRGPDRVGDYAILQLLHYDGGRQLSFEESSPLIDESLQNQRSDEALQAMIGRLKKRYSIAWRPELVMLIRLVDDSAY